MNAGRRAPVRDLQRQNEALLPLRGVSGREVAAAVERLDRAGFRIVLYPLGWLEALNRLLRRQPTQLDAPRGLRVILDDVRGLLALGRV